MASHRQLQGLCSSRLRPYILSISPYSRQISASAYFRRFKATTAHTNLKVSDVKREKNEPYCEAYSKLDLAFESSQEAYKSKTTLELLRAALVLRLCSIGWIVDRNKEVCVYVSVLSINKIYEVELTDTAAAWPYHRHVIIMTVICCAGPHVQHSHRLGRGTVEVDSIMV
jgi:hypothetical protein